MRVTQPELTMKPQNQELAFDPISPPIYERKLREPGVCWVAFCLYRDLGPKRTVVDAYRQWRTQRDAAGDAPPLIPRADVAPRSLYPPAAWKKWAKRWEWEARVRAYDDDQEAERKRILDIEAEERRKARVEQLIAQDAVHFQEITQMNGVIQELLKQDLAKVREYEAVLAQMPAVGGAQIPVRCTAEYDRLKAFEVLMQQRGLLEERYFGLALAGKAPPPDAPQVHEVRGTFSWDPGPEEIAEAAPQGE